MGGCKNVSTQSTSNSKFQKNSKSVAERETTVNSEVTGTITNVSEQNWISTEVQISNDVSQLTFAGQNKGWACGKNSMFETSDGGKTWKLVNSHLNLVERGDEIEKLEFDVDGIGWLVVQHNAGDEFSRKDQIRVYRSPDAGKSWTLSVSQPSATFSDLRSSEKETWLIGKTFLGSEPQRLVPLILYFSKPKKKWEDLSHTFNSSLNVNNDEYFHFPSLSKIGSAEDRCVFLASEERTVFQTCDKGKTWDLINSHGNPDHPLKINQIRVTHDSVNLLEAVGGVEGTESVLTTFDRPNGKSTRTVALNSYYLTGAAWGPDNEILAAGAFRGSPLKDAAEDTRKDKDVVLRTIDDGNTWTEVFSRAFGHKSGTFFFAGQQTIWLIDENGVVRRIAKP